MMILPKQQDEWELEGPTSVSIGVFDGVHLGHRRLLQLMDPSMTSLVLTFDPHPVEVLRPEISPRLLTTIDERVALLGAAGVERVGVLDLSSIRDLAPEEFVKSLLIDKLSMGQVVVGPDFRFGKDRTGDINLLTSLGEEYGYSVRVAEFWMDDEGVVSSSRLRNLVEAGQVAAVSDAMGSRFTLTGPVVHGDKRGRELGFPTANLLPVARKVIPGHGVYAALAHTSEGMFKAAVNVGVRPTFDGEKLLIEAYILDFEGDLYDQSLTIEFVDYLRPELRFDGVDALVEAMEADVDKTRALLADTESTMPGVS